MNELLTSLRFVIRADDSNLTGWHHHWGSDMGQMFFGSAMMLLFWGAVVALIILAVRWFAMGRGDDASRSETALDVLKRRFANGEIDEAEYEARRKVLSK